MARATHSTDDQGSRLMRRHFVRGLFGLGAAGGVGIVSADPAAAADGDALLVGQDNTSTTKTTLGHTSTGEWQDWGVQLSSDGHATLAVGGEPGGDPDYVRYAVWADMQSDRLGDSAIKADAKNGFALEGRNTSTGFPAVAGTNQGTGPGLGGMSEGGGPQLYLETEAFTGDGPVGPPTAGPQQIGGIRLDVNGDLWVCVEAGTPGTWTRFVREDQVGAVVSGRTIPIAPIRALDTRATGGRPSGSPAVPGQKKGPLTGGETITLDLAGVTPIPATASGVIGNLIVPSPSYTGYLRAAPSGAPLTATALSFAPGPNTGNAFIAGLGPNGVAFRASGTTTNHYELVVDITAYIT